MVHLFLMGKLSMKHSISELMEQEIEWKERMM